eukprot:7198313-Prymnesium_polylepis.1
MHGLMSTVWSAKVSAPSAVRRAKKPSTPLISSSSAAPTMLQATASRRVALAPSTKAAGTAACWPTKAQASHPARGGGARHRRAPPRRPR